MSRYDFSSEDEMFNNFMISNMSLFNQKAEEMNKKRLEYLKTEDPILHKEINRQFKSKLDSLIYFEVTTRTSISSERALTLIEQMNSTEYLLGVIL
jgi:hypothetical protein